MTKYKIRMPHDSSSYTPAWALCFYMYIKILITLLVKKEKWKEEVPFYTFNWRMLQN